MWVVLAAAALFAAITGAGLAWWREVRLRHVEQLADRDRRYQILLEQTQEAVAVSIDGKVAYANPACVEMFGYERPLIGVPVTIFFAPGSREQVEEIVHQRAAGRPAPELYEAVGLRADGATFDVEVRVAPIEFDGRAGSQAILRDISGKEAHGSGTARIRGALPAALRAQPRGRLPLHGGRATARVQPRLRPDDGLRIARRGDGAAARARSTARRPRGRTSWPACGARAAS